MKDILLLGGPGHCRKLTMSESQTEFEASTELYAMHPTMKAADVAVAFPKHFTEEEMRVAFAHWHREVWSRDHPSN